MAHQKLFIDDERFPPAHNESEWAVVRTSAQAIAWVQEHGVPEFISFDHDLGGDDTAMLFVHWLIDFDLDHPGSIPKDFAFEVHSQNSVGVQNLRGLLGNYLRFREVR